MDFAEIYLCQSCDEVQSAYWSSTMVSLHPVVVDFKDMRMASCNTKASFTRQIIFPTIQPPFFFSILKKFLPELPPSVSPLKCIHYWTDSATSQYWNKTIFSLIANHKSEFGFPAVWNYFEAGHGKGPCDGVGGSAKRMVDKVVKTGKVKIQDVVNFYDWARKNENNSSVSYRFYS